MIIRHITEKDDYAAVSDIYEQSWRYAYKGIIPQDYLDSIPHGRWINGINAKGRTDIGAFEDDRIVGTASFCTSRWDKFPESGEIVSIYLLPEYIGRGIGACLLKKCIEELEWEGFRSVILWVLEENVHARLFYEKHGFTATSEIMEDNIGGRELNEIMYIRRLKKTEL